MTINLKPCPFCSSPVKWCGENEVDPEDNHLCHHIQCINPECAADFDFNTNNIEILPEETDHLSAEELMVPFREECARRFNRRSHESTHPNKP